MATYQNNMRYGRMGTGGLQQRQNYNSRTPVREVCNETNVRIQNCEECPKEFPGFPVAMAYVSWQSWCEIYETGKGLHRGTIFQELDLPFLGKGGCNR